MDSVTGARAKPLLHSRGVPECEADGGLVAAEDGVALDEVEPAGSGPETGADAKARPGRARLMERLL